MRATDIGKSYGIHAARLSDAANFAEKIYSEAWQSVLIAAGVPGEIYPAGDSSERLLTIASTLAQWLGTAEGQTHILSAIDAVADGDDVDFWHPSPNEILTIGNCQDSEMAFGFFDWLSTPAGFSFVERAQERISVFRDENQ
ncbi:hypothetical protein [Pseudomonas sp. NPDC089569]|uniref:hypothetical protein n=1 Tax=Pseudomonas sp. NPDC089569 TaxID=3390722 RepID=UPI003D003B04